MAHTALNSPDLLASLQQHFNNQSQNSLKLENLDSSLLIEQQAQLSLLKNFQNQTSTIPSNQITQMATALLINQYNNSLNLFSSNLSKF